jgi:hypothetical protein
MRFSDPLFTRANAFGGWISIRRPLHGLGDVVKLMSGQWPPRVPPTWFQAP